MSRQTAGVQIRDLSADDLSAVHAINEAEAPAVGSVTVEGMRTVIEHTSIALVATTQGDGDHPDGTIAGFCLVIPPGTAYGSGNYAWFSERYDDFVYLDRVAISPAFQGRGIGRLLYDEVERVAAERHPTATDFLLEVNLRPRNDGSLAFHDRLGFAQVAERETDYGVLVSMMSKSL